MPGSFFALPPALLAFVVSSVLPFASAQYPPIASYQAVLTSPLNSKITISYRQPDAGTCETAFSSQKQYSGYISFPPQTLAPIQQDYAINTFFWFSEARQNASTAPLTIWLNGGPGSSSMVGFFNEMGPCTVVQMNDGEYGTQMSEWGWDRSSNVLFIDQPSQVGLSYDVATNASYDLYANEVYEPPTSPNTGLPSYMYLNGTFGTASADDPVPWSSTANTTQIAAEATWHFLQSWLSAFPQYNPAVRPNATTYPSGAVVGVNLFTESYGGKYGPVMASLFEEKNERRANGSIPVNKTLAIQLESVGIMNGLVDDLIQDYYYPKFAYNNTYGIQAMSLTDELNSLQAFSGADGCSDQILACRSAASANDPLRFGDNTDTNTICKNAQYACANVSAAYYNAGYDPYDIRQKIPNPNPPAAYAEYLNTADVQRSIGAMVNYTESSRYVQAGFIATGDTIRGGQIEDLAYLLRKGIRVALIYGDADFVCNWYGGEAVSLAIASILQDYPSADSSSPTNAVNALSSPVPYAQGFPAAGYAEIVTNSSYVGGSVRQFGNLSFSRIYDAGHLVPYWQPETAFTVFTRIIMGQRIATGELADLSRFSSTGPANSTHTNIAPSTAPSPTCWVRSFNATCGAEDLKAMLSDQGIVANGIFYRDGSIKLPSSTVEAGAPGQPLPSSFSSNGAAVSMPSQSSMQLTGVYTATATPSPSKGAAAATRGSGTQHWSPLGAVVMGLVAGVLVLL